MEKEKEELKEWARKLRDSGKIVIVEGKKDIIALKSAGISDIVAVNLHKRPLYALAEEISSAKKEAVILTDFDKKGKELYGKLRKEFAREGIKTDRYFREFLQNNTKLSHIEGLQKYLNNLDK